MGDQANRDELKRARPRRDRQEPIPDALAHELSRLLGPDSGLHTPADLDERILAESRRALSPANRHRRQLRRAAPLAAAAGLAIAGWIGFTLWMNPGTSQPGKTGTTRPGGSTIAQGPTTESTNPYDIDRSGRVDILDAFRIAIALDRNEPTESAWDVTGDGLITVADVDTIAQAGVALGESSS